MENREEFLTSHYLLEDIPAPVFAHMAAELIGGIAGDAGNLHIQCLTCNEMGELLRCFLGSLAEVRTQTNGIEHAE